MLHFIALIIPFVNSGATSVSVLNIVVRTEIKCGVSGTSGVRMIKSMPFDSAQVKRSIGMGMLCSCIRVYSFRPCGLFLQEKHKCDPTYTLPGSVIVLPAL